MNNEHTLPTTDPSSGAGNRSDRPKAMCFRLVVQHDMREAGESRWAPWAALFATRLLSSLTCIAMVVLLALGYSRLSSLASYVGLCFAGLTYLGLATCTFLQGKGARASRKSGFSTAVVFLHSITATLSVLLIAEFITIVIFTHYNIGFDPSSLIILTPLVAYLLDVLVMQARIRLRFRYCLFFLISAALYTIIEIVVLRVTCRNCLYGFVAVWSVGFNLGIGLVASLIAVLLTRISWPCFRD